MDWKEYRKMSVKGKTINFFQVIGIILMVIIFVVLGAWCVSNIGIQGP